MGNHLVYSPVGMRLMLLFALLIFAVVGVLFLDLARTAFTNVFADSILTPLFMETPVRF